MCERKNAVRSTSEFEEVGRKSGRASVLKGRRRGDVVDVDVASRREINGKALRQNGNSPLDLSTMFAESTWHARQSTDSGIPTATLSIYPISACPSAEATALTSQFYCEAHVSRR
jgi:hypothetical protein